MTKPFPITEPTGLRLRYAAAHCGISEGHFKRMVAEGILPEPRRLGGVHLWLRQELDAALFAISPACGEGGENTCDAAFGI